MFSQNTEIKRQKIKCQISPKSTGKFTFETSPLLPNWLQTSTGNRVFSQLGRRGEVKYAKRLPYSGNSCRYFLILKVNRKVCINTFLKS